MVADTHVGEFLPALPHAVLEALEGVDLVLHAGDLSVPSVLDELGALAPVVAVRGDHDRLGGVALPEVAVVQAGGHRIGLTHGRRAWPVDASVIASHVLAGRRLPYRAGLHRALLRRTGPVDVLVYGHWHEPYLGHAGTTLLFSPGAVCPWGSLEGGASPRPGAAGAADRAVRRYRWQLGAAAMRPAVGVLELGSAGVRPRILPLASSPAAHPEPDR